MSNFYTDVIQKDPRYNSTHVDNVVCDMNLLEPGTRGAVSQMMAMAKAASLGFKSISGYAATVFRRDFNPQPLSPLVVGGEK